MLKVYRYKMRAPTAQSIHEMSGLSVESFDIGELVGAPTLDMTVDDSSLAILTEGMGYLIPPFEFVGEVV